MGYKKPLLREVYAEVHLAEGALNTSAFMRLGVLLSDAGLTETELGKVATISQLIQPQGIELHQSEQVRIRCWSPDKTQLAQYSPDQFFVNLIGDYPGWDAFQQLTVRIETAVSKVATRPVELKQVSLVTIDELVAPMEGFRLGRYFECGGRYFPSLFADCAVGCDINIGRGVLESDGTNEAVLLQARPGKKDCRVVVQAVFRTTQNLQRPLMTVLNELHEISSKAFESMITSETRNTVMGGLK